MLNSHFIYRYNSDIVKNFIQNYKKDYVIYCIPVMDDIVINELYKSNGAPNGNKLSFLNKSNPYLYNYLVIRYNDSTSLSETLYRIKNKIEVHPLCPTCGKPIRFVGIFKKHCSSKCSANDPETRNKCKQTCIERYNVDNVYKSKEIINKIKETNIKKYGSESYTQTEEYRQRARATCLRKYGVESYTQTEEYKRNMLKTLTEKYGVINISQIDAVKKKKEETFYKRYGVRCNFCDPDIKEQIAKTNIERYGYPTPSSSDIVKEKVRNTCLQRYNVECTLSLKEVRDKGKVTSMIKYGCEFPSQSDIVKTKINETKHRRHTFGTSKTEEECYELLLTKFNNVIRQYKCEKYPFACDFYIPDLDLYIEYNGTWTHGRHPFNPDDENDIEKLKLWQSKNSLFYNSAIHCWTVRDPMKRNVAKENNLNYIEFWSLQELQTWINEIEKN